jgi:hypothetical protein
VGEISKAILALLSLSFYFYGHLIQTNLLLICFTGFFVCFRSVAGLKADTVHFQTVHSFCVGFPSSLEELADTRARDRRLVSG